MPEPSNPASPSLKEDLHFRILRALDAQPDMSQRELAEELGVSVGKAHYCLHALVDKGWLKVRNFANSNRKTAYAYLLTPAGIDEKARIAVRFLKRKMEEYDALKREIEVLQREFGSGQDTQGSQLGEASMGPQSKKPGA